MAKHPGQGPELTKQAGEHDANHRNGDAGPPVTGERGRVVTVRNESQVVGEFRCR